ncbi:MAG: electron transfer flavoprotein subunit beta/FixA family protein [Bacteroidia bacterium]|nr:electron transfer flavoprotein subunit beta/FixA family protein [Bacteroidia bacterium]
MKILVPISNVPDTTSKISFTDNDTRFNGQGITWIVNPYDEWYALVRALELKESGKADKVTIIHVGLSDSEPTIRKGLALGADDAVRINAESSDSLYVAYQIADYAKNNSYELILTGKESIQYNGSAVGSMIAALLDYPFLSQASFLDLNGTTLTLHVETEGGIKVVEGQAPAVVSCAKGMAEQRIPNMRGIMAARTKPLQTLDPKPFRQNVKVRNFGLNPGRSECKLFTEDQLDKLVEALHKEAKVI